MSCGTEHGQDTQLDIIYTLCTEHVADVHTLHVNSPWDSRQQNRTLEAVLSTFDSYLFTTSSPQVMP